MFSPISKAFLALAAVLAIAACGTGQSTDEALAEAESGLAEEVALDEKIECALAGKTGFERVCTTETIAGNEGTILVVRHPDGGFRRFKILTDGRGLAAADGFDDVKIKVLGGGMIEVGSGDDIYRLPAAIKASEAKAKAAEAG
jgi:hypothetical protein